MAVANILAHCDEATTTAVLSFMLQIPLKIKKTRGLFGVWQTYSKLSNCQSTKQSVDEMVLHHLIHLSVCHRQK
jgi:hypothetical protein